MNTVSRTFSVDASPAVVVPYLADFAHAEQWDPGPPGTGLRHWVRSVLWTDDRLKWLYWLAALLLALYEPVKLA